MVIGNYNEVQAINKEPVQAVGGRPFRGANKACPDMKEDESMENDEI